MVLSIEVEDESTHHVIWDIEIRHIPAWMAMLRLRWHIGSWNKRVHVDTNSWEVITMNAKPSKSRCRNTDHLKRIPALRYGWKWTAGGRNKRCNGKPSKILGLFGEEGILSRKTTSLVILTCGQEKLSLPKNEREHSTWAGNERLQKRTTACLFPKWGRRAAFWKRTESANRCAFNLGTYLLMQAKSKGRMEQFVCHGREKGDKLSNRFT